MKEKGLFTRHGRMIGRGVIIGGTMLIPGVSGGSMAMILGIYDTLIRAISSFRKDVHNNVMVLGTIGLGGLLGIVLLAKPLELLLVHFPTVMMYFFMGAVGGGVPTIVRKTGATHFSWRYLCYVALGIFIVLGLGALPFEHLLSGTEGVSALFAMALAGFVSAFALLLPGISGSYILLMLGLYEDMIDAIIHLRLDFLLPLLLGMLVGVLLTARLLELAIRRYPGVTHLVILGFLLGSLVEIFPGIPQGFGWISCPLALLLGAGAIWILGRQTKGE